MYWYSCTLISCVVDTGGGGGGGRGTPYDGLNGEASPKNDTFFRLEVKG